MNRDLHQEWEDEQLLIEHEEHPERFKKVSTSKPVSERPQSKLLPNDHRENASRLTSADPESQNP